MSGQCGVCAIPALLNDHIRCRFQSAAWSIWRLDYILYFFCKQKTAYEIRLSLVGSEICIRAMNESESLLNFDAVMQSVIEYFEGIVDGADREVISAELIVDHMKDGKTLIPVWAFQINEKPLNDSEYQYELRVNAITGKIIVQ